MRQCQLLGRLLRDERGATAIEYGLILALLCIGLVTIMAATGGEVVEMWSGVDAQSDAAISNGAPAAD